MMGYESWSMWGFHAFWWALWIVLTIVILFALFSSIRRTRAREAPLQTLQRRYAAGEISTKEYEERKARLEHDGTSRAQ